MKILVLVLAACSSPSNGAIVSVTAVAPSAGCQPVLTGDNATEEYSAICQIAQINAGRPLYCRVAAGAEPKCDPLFPEPAKPKAEPAPRAANQPAAPSEARP